MVDHALPTAPRLLHVEWAPGSPATVRVSESVAPGSLTSWLTAHRAVLRVHLRRYGHLLVRGLPLRNQDDFAAARDVLLEAPAPGDREETTPRTALGNGVFSATDLPPEQSIRLHNEDSYSIRFPGVLLFCCLRPADRGGETTLGDTRAVLRSLPIELVDRFRRSGWLVTRNFHRHIGLTWQRAFGTTWRDELETYCRTNLIGWHWDSDRLRTTGLRPAMIRHPSTAEESWCNHIAVFNEWTHNDEVREILLSTFGRDGLPQNTFYGDGTPIDQADVETINRAYDRVTKHVRWSPGDLLLVDNILCAHGREPFSGTRTVLVAMGEPIDMTTAPDAGPLGPAARPVGP